MGDFFKPWQRKLSVALLLSAFVLMGWWARSFVVDCRLLNANRLDATDTPSDKAPEFAWGTYNPTDSTTYQVISYDSGSFSVDGSPVQGKLKAYLAAASAEGKLTIFINHPDGESSKWVEMPMPLYLSLTDESPSALIPSNLWFMENSGDADELYHELTSHSNGNAVLKELLESIFNGIPRDLRKETSYQIKGQRDDENHRYIRVRLEQRIEIERRLDERGQEGWYNISIGDHAHFTEARIGVVNGNGKVVPVPDLTTIGDEVIRVVLIDRDGVPISAKFQSGSTTKSRHAGLKDLARFCLGLPNNVSSIGGSFEGPEKGKVIVEVWSKEIELTIVRGTPWVLQSLQLVGTSSE